MIGGTALTIVMSLLACCANVHSFERILQVSSQVNTILTLTQSIFILIALNSYSFLVNGRGLGVRLNTWGHLTPIILQNITAYLTNYAFEFNVSMPTNIILRSTGTVMTMVIGAALYHKKYTKLEIVGALLISIGTVVFTIDIQSPAYKEVDGSPLIGMTLLIIATMLASFTSLHKEKLFLSKVSWVETMYFNYLYGLVIYIPLIPKIAAEMEEFRRVSSSDLASNWVTQFLCVSFVNVLMVRVSALTLNIILLCRRIVSIVISVVYMGDGVSHTAFIGVCSVIFGAFMYIIAVDKKLKRTLKKVE